MLHQRISTNSEKYQENSRNRSPSSGLASMPGRLAPWRQSQPGRCHEMPEIYPACNPRKFILYTPSPRICIPTICTGYTVIQCHTCIHHRHVVTYISILHCLMPTLSLFSRLQCSRRFFRLDSRFLPRGCRCIWSSLIVAVGRSSWMIKHGNLIETTLVAWFNLFGNFQQLIPLGCTWLTWLGSHLFSHHRFAGQCNGGYGSICLIPRKVCFQYSTWPYIFWLLWSL